MTVSSPDAVRDPERLTTPPQSCRRLNLLLLLSVLALALALAALGAFVLLRWPCEGKEKTVEIETAAKMSDAEKMATAARAALEIAVKPEVAAATAAKERNGAHLIAGDVEVTEKLVVPWHHSNYLDSVSIGPDFDYKPELKQLEILKEGLYYLYAQLSVTCVQDPCTQKGNITLAIERGALETSVLQIPLKLPEKKASTFSGTLLCLSRNDRLQGRLHVQGATKYTRWQLDQDNLNFFGLLRVRSACKE
ncbi:tumor necrosis factor ligand superfamily member 9 [Microcaecilia unicolor]|uniref:Uncharacterized protein LOC115464889 n=1 Tax=Microcaecilia unicolor TaxID=1415580 RepID=A0A6P7X689_9AMPH|nr:uncharacterized protein LOC115464889 [Microcaecilia unicolor]